MINKESKARFYAPSIKELQYAQRNSKGIAGLLLAALGITTAGYGTKKLLEGLDDSKLSDDLPASAELQRRIRLAKAKLDNEYIYNTPEEQHPFTEEELAELERLKKLSKKAAFDIPMHLEVGTSGKEAPSDIKQNLIDKLLFNTQTGKFKGKPVALDLNKVLGSSDKDLAEKLHYYPKSLLTNSKWTKYISNPLASMGPQSVLPLAAVAGGGLVAAPFLSKWLVKGISKLLPKSKRKSDFLDAAKEIYEDAAKELQEVGYKKEKDDIKNKKEASLKFAKKKDGPEVSATHIGGNPLMSTGNIPTVLLAALLAYAAGKGASGFSKGFERAHKETAHKTQFLRGWQAMNKLRDYNYNPLTVELEEEPGLKTKTMREKNEKVRALLEDLKDSDNIEFSPNIIRNLS